jgi:tRNA dimethylallyltransferase
VFEQTGRSIVLWQKELRIKNKYPKSKLFMLDINRETLATRIELRCKEMIKNGVIDEVEAFIKKTEDVVSQLKKAVGFVEIKNYLDGKCSIEEMTALMITATRQYAKRQQTWFRTQYAANDVFLIPFDRPQVQASAIVKHIYTANSKRYA